jgi:phosphatidate cytidylyltransferase
MPIHPFIDGDVARLVGGVTIVLGIATAFGQVLGRRARSDSRRAAIANLNLRIASWWVMCGVVLASLLIGKAGFVALFAAISFGALREFITLAPTRRADHRVLLLAFFVVIPLQYTLIALGRYELFSVAIPICGALVVPAASAARGDTERFMERVAGIQWGLMVCVYCVSYTPALLTLDIPGFEGQNAKLLLFLLVVVESSDVLQYIWGKLSGRRAVAPMVSPNKTVEGFVGGIASSSLLGAALWRLTPFRPWQGALLSFVVTTVGFGGGLIMSAIKRDRGVKDFGSSIAGHGGILDRVDSLCFAGPVFYHLTRCFFAV